MRVGLIGYPVAHSASPAMHTAAFAALGIEGRYELWPVAPGRLDEALRALRAEGFDGANVTVPHKQAVLRHLDALTETAERLGAVNTIWVEGDALHGDNTDLPGFLAHLQAEQVPLANRRALVLGAGGSARAVVAALQQAGCAGIAILNRDPRRAHDLAQALRAADLHAVLGSTPREGPPRRPSALTVARFPQDLIAHADADLIVNCTPLGMGDGALAWDPELSFRPGQVVYDLVYRPRETPLLAKAAADGARALGGVGMLVHQGALSFARWTGRPAPLEVMMRAVEDAC